MILGVLIVLASALHAWLGGWMVVVVATAVVGIAAMIEAWTGGDVIVNLLLLAIVVAMGTMIYDFWWHNMAGSMRSSGAALAYYNDLKLSEGLLMALVLAKMVKAFNGQ